MRFLSSANYLNNLQIYKSSGSNTVTCYSSLDINGSFTLQNGTFDAPASIYVAGNWNNLDGPAYFVEGTGTVVLDGSGTQTVSTETFHTLVLDKSAGEMVINTGSIVHCASYDWAYGAYKVDGGEFHAGDLMDPGIVGHITLDGGGLISYNQDSASRIDLRGTLLLYEGQFDVSGGSDNAHFSYGTDTASLWMGAASLNFIDQGVVIPNITSFNYVQSGGTISTGGDFMVESASFSPLWGIIKLTGDQDCVLAVASGSVLPNLHVQKIPSSVTVTVTGPLDIRGDFWLMTGYFVAPASMALGGDWVNYLGPSQFIEGTGTVTFNSDVNQGILDSETFHMLSLAKTGGTLTIPTGTTVNCASFDWVSGSYEVTGGTFNADDLADDAIYGIITISVGTVSYHQDQAQSILPRGILTMQGGEFNIYGGSGNFALTYDPPFNMSGGVLDIKDQGFSPWNASNYQITGGTIRTAGDLIAAWFNPAGGTIELYGAGDAYMFGGEGVFHDVTINKTGFVIMDGTIVIGGTLKSQSGTWDIGSDDSVTCAIYLWEGGGYRVYGGTFTAQDLANPGIFGSILLHSGTINYHQDTAAGSFVDLNADLQIFSGIFNVYGGCTASRWPYSADATLSIFGGDLYMRDQSIVIDDPVGCTLTCYFADGAIHTVGDFMFLRSPVHQFDGKVILYGGNNCVLKQDAGSFLGSVWINKSSDSVIVTGDGPLYTNGNFTIISGTFIAPPLMTVTGNWYVSNASSQFVPGTGCVVFAGSGQWQGVEGMNFYDVTDYNSGSGLAFYDGGSISGTLTVTNHVRFYQGGTINTVSNSIPTAVLEFMPSYFKDIITAQISFYWGGGTMISLYNNGITSQVCIGDLLQNGIYGSFVADGGSIEIHQDAGNLIDLNGSVTILNDGRIDIYGGSQDCAISTDGPVNFIMSSGEFNVRDRGIGISASPHACEFEISGGIIRCNGSFVDNRGGFDPSGGTIEFTGPWDRECFLQSGSWLQTMRVNKQHPLYPELDFALVLSDLTIKGGLVIEKGFVYVGELLSSLNGGDITVNAGALNLQGEATLISTGNLTLNAGTIRLDSGSSLKMSGFKLVSFSPDGYLEAIGEPGEPATFTHHDDGYYGFFTSGAMALGHVVFEYMDQNGIVIATGAWAFDNKISNCTFQNGQAGGVLLNVSNEQHVTFPGAQFPANTWGGLSNVAKWVDVGYAVFPGYSGDFSGPDFENDAHNRVYWLDSGESLVTGLEAEYSTTGDEITLVWQCLAPALYYNVYVSEFPEGPFTFLESTPTTPWSGPLSLERRFFRITAELP